MINLETPKKFEQLLQMAHTVADEVFMPISRKYDREEHTRPKELDMLAALMEGMDDAGGTEGAGAAAGRVTDTTQGNKNGANMSTALGIAELCRADVGLLLSMPGQGLGNSAIAAVANDEQLARFGDKWAAMAITEPEAGSDSAAIRTTAVLDEQTGEYVLNGEKIYVTAGERCDVVVVWASLDLSIGRPAIKSFIVERSNPGMILERLEHKLGIRASDTAAFRLVDCRIPKENLLGDPEINVEKGFAGVMQTFDNTRPLVAAMAVGLTRGCLEDMKQRLDDAGLPVDYDRPAALQPAAVAEYLEMEADYEAARLLMMQATWMADNRVPNSVNASMAKAKAGRTCVDIALRCIALAGALGYSEETLVEKRARDAKILDIFEGTQQIQLLIIARQLLKKSSAELK